jgi:hypothetical protein
LISFVEPKWAAKAIAETIKNEEKTNSKTILTAMMKASDPETGQKPTAQETAINSTAMMYI